METILKMLAEEFAKKQSRKKLEGFAATPGPDIQFNLPKILGGREYDIYVTEETADKPHEKARKLVKVTVSGKTFQFWRHKVK